MTETVIRCDVSGCDYVASHTKPVVVKRMIGCHKSKLHGIKGESYYRNHPPDRGKRKYKKRGVNVLQVVNVKTQPVAMLDGVNQEMTVRELMEDIDRLQNFLVAFSAARRIRR